jgi:hypothetical protein
MTSASIKDKNWLPVLDRFAELGDMEIACRRHENSSPYFEDSRMEKLMQFLVLEHR